MKERVLNQLNGLVRENYRITLCQSLIAEVKGDDTIDEENKTKILSFADKVLAADVKIAQEALVMVSEYSSSPNINASEEDEDGHGFY